MDKVVTAAQALTGNGWEENVAVEIGTDGRIASVHHHDGPTDHAVLLPAPSNLHSHAFQRAMAGLTERRGPDPSDLFWSWRELMYRFLDRLTPDQVEVIAAFAQMEMLEAGYASVGEFHYVHHQANGRPYARLSEMADRIVSAAEETGIGLTLLPVLYQQGGLDGRALEGGQRRFGCALDQFSTLVDQSAVACRALTNPATLGIAPHSLRAVPKSSLETVAQLRPTDPLHLHIAEQTAEVTAVESAYGARPVAWLLDNFDVDPRWCLVHATHMTVGETEGLAHAGAVAGLCPVTEASLGDGIFEAVKYVGADGAYGVGTDSNIRISLVEELRTLAYSQRYRDRSRAAMASTAHSTGRALFSSTAVGGAQAIGRDCGVIAEGRLADLIALEASHPDLEGLKGDALLDAWIFAKGDTAVRKVWSAGQLLVNDGHHLRRHGITRRYRDVVKTLKEAL